MKPTCVVKGGIGRGELRKREMSKRMEEEGAGTLSRLGRTQRLCMLGSLPYHLCALPRKSAPPPQTLHTPPTPALSGGVVVRLGEGDAGADGALRPHDPVAPVEVVDQGQAPYGSWGL